MATEWCVYCVFIEAGCAVGMLALAVIVYWRRKRSCPAGIDWKGIEEELRKF